MKWIEFKSFCIIFLVAFCLILSSCKMPENILQTSSEVDFSTPRKVQISFNEHIYDTVIVYNNSKLEINFIDEKDLVSGAYVSLTISDYKITYKDMCFEGEFSDLTPSFLPCVIYDFISSFESATLLDSFNKERECYFVKKDVNGYFITFESYEADDNKIYSMEIK